MSDGTGSGCRSVLWFFKTHEALCIWNGTSGRSQNFDGSVRGGYFRQEYLKKELCIQDKTAKKCKTWLFIHSDQTKVVALNDGNCYVTFKLLRHGGLWCVEYGWVEENEDDDVWRHLRGIQIEWRSFICFQLCGWDVCLRENRTLGVEIVLQLGSIIFG